MLIKVFDRVDHWVLATVLESARFKLEFHKWINMMYNSGAAFGGFHDQVVHLAGLAPISSSLYPCFRASVL